MPQSGKNEIERREREAKGAAKEKMGQVTNVPNVAAKGRAEKLAGRAQAETGEIESASEK